MILGMSFLSLAIALVAAWFFYRYAKRKGKARAWLWAVGGFFVPTVAMFVFAIVWKKLKPAAGIASGG
jgi:purine-cytosine permease-like protein